MWVCVREGGGGWLGWGNLKTKVVSVAFLVHGTFVDMIKPSVTFHEYITYGLGVMVRPQFYQACT